jgi:CRISPR-associated protein Csd1
MILQELTHLYGRLAANPEIDICPPGFSRENISFKIVIKENGELFDPDNPITDLRSKEGKNLIPKKIMVPKFDGKRANGVKPYFLWDKSDYIIGVKRDLKAEMERDKIIDKSDPNYQFEIVEVAKEQHKEGFLKLIDTISGNENQNNSLLAVKKFCTSVKQTEQLRNSVHWNDFLNTFVVFQVIESGNNHIFEDEEIKTLWEKYYNSSAEKDNKKGICLVEGSELSYARLHPTIKKGVGGKNDIPLVSCNFDAGESYNKSKNENSPISSKAASAIAGALNYLLDTKSHNLTIADAKTVFWAESQDPYADLFSQIMGKAKDDVHSAELVSFLKSIRSGKMPGEINNVDRFFILGLSPNAARISVRFWMVDLVDNIFKKIGKHFADLQIIPEREHNAEFPSMWQLLIETATLHKTENISPNITGPLMRSILSCTKYPTNILSILIARMRADQDFNKLNYYRAAFIKAILNRNYNKELTMSLDITRESIPYLLGRLFSILEKVQEESAGGSLNATIKDRYFSTASTSPKVVFPVILRLAQNHFKKLKSTKPGLAVVREKEMTNVIGMLEPVMPATLKLEDQGEFAIGYYHQRQDFFKKKEEGSGEAD